MKISGGTTFGNCATGSPTRVTRPTMTMMIEITMATMGRLMKNFDMAPSSRTIELLENANRGATFHPEGMPDNSPTLQRWVPGRPPISPEGTVENCARFSAVPSGLVNTCNCAPNVETLGYYRPSLRDDAEI